MSLDWFTEKEKLDYIFLTMRKNEKNQRISLYFTWWYRIIILLYMLYFFFVTIPNFLDKIPSFPKEWDFINFEEIIKNPRAKALYDSYFWTE